MQNKSPQSAYPKTNLCDPRQDVHKVRRHNPDLFRYQIAEKLLPGDISGLSILELGGGTGEFSRRLKNKGAEITFVDLNENNVLNAVEKNGVKASRLDLNSGLGNFADASFTGVVMLDVIEHMVAAEFLLAEINRVLKSGGFLILSVPNFAYILNRCRMFLGRLGIDEGYHYRFFTKKTLEAKLINAGFRVEKQFNSSPFIGMNIIVNKLFKKPRRHIHVTNCISGLFAQSLAVNAKKK